MNKQTVQKIKLFAGGLSARFSENKDLFLEVRGNYKSGTVAYPFVLSYDGEYRLDFQKESLKGDWENLFSSLIEQANLYDELELIYADRTGRLILRADNRNVTTKSDNQVVEVANKEEAKHLISPKKANALLTALDFVTENGKLKNSHVRKFSQAEHFIELLVPYIKKLPEDREIKVYDLACGKSYLSFFLNYYLCDVMKKKCRIIGVDIREDVIEASKKIRDELKYFNMDFYTADILQFEPPTEMDIAISLHACDVATDFAIAAAVNNGAKIAAIAPCCHKEFLDSIQSDSLSFFMDNGIFKKRFSDLLTDVYRVKTLEEHGYDVMATEFVSPLETPKNLLILAEKKTGTAQKEKLTQNIKKQFGVDPILDKLIFDF